MSQNTDIQQLTQTVANLAQSLEQSQRHVRRTQRLFSAAFAIFMIITVSLVAGQSGFVKNAYASNPQQPSLEDMMKKFMPVIEAMGTLVIRIKQDSDILRAKALMRANPDKYPAGTSIDQFTDKELNSFDASSALFTGSIAEEVTFINDSLRRMTNAMELMSRNMNSTLGRMGDFMP